ncbi:uncharacterized protein LOC130047237 [Ostrea edulis]|uniref:uncharacterized protein LOC130047237 n=1 Tax=Ostrea edulis TaxID=37623 RepID=UPI0024AEEC93|nr:uncharacterized protein LOC130047237 [Ostrea edulis]
MQGYHAGQMSESFEVKTGVRQGCLLSSFLFLLVIDWIMRTTTSDRNNGIQWTLLTQLDDLDFADDLVLLSHNHSQMQDKTSHLVTTSAGTGLKINLKKTELIKINTTVQLPVTVSGASSTSDGLKRKNEELWKRAGQEHLDIQIRRRNWGWIGHTPRKPPSSTTHQALTWNPQYKRKTKKHPEA